MNKITKIDANSKMIICNINSEVVEAMLNENPHTFSYGTNLWSEKIKKIEKYITVIQVMEINKNKLIIEYIENKESEKND